MTIHPGIQAQGGRKSGVHKIGGLAYGGWPAFFFRNNTELVSKFRQTFVIIVEVQTMQTFTKNEITWMLEAVKLTEARYITHSQLCNGAEKSLVVLRAEQLDVIAGKIDKALESRNKHIAIKY